MINLLYKILNRIVKVKIFKKVRKTRKSQLKNYTVTWKFSRSCPPRQSCEQERMISERTKNHGFA